MPRVGLACDERGIEHDCLVVNVVFTRSFFFSFFLYTSSSVSSMDMNVIKGSSLLGIDIYGYVLAQLSLPGHMYFSSIGSRPIGAPTLSPKAPSMLPES
jgi:hypothetical protein